MPSDQGPTAVRIIRPGRDAEFLQSDDDLARMVKMVTKMTQADIDHGAAGHIMIDQNFEPTGEPPPDPPGAYCLICKERIWAHDSNTAFPTRVRFKDEANFDVGGGACCERCSLLTDDEITARIQVMSAYPKSKRPAN
jgi:hypothetical protein